MSQQDAKMVTVRMPLELYDKVKDDAESQGASISDVVREAVVRLYENPVPKAVQMYEDYIQPVKELCDTLSGQLETKDRQFQAQLEAKEQQLQTKDQQIDQLHQLLAMKEKSISEAMAQLNRATLQLDDLRQSRTMWQRIKAAFASEAVG